MASQKQPLTGTARAFLAQYVSPEVLEVFPEWQGILIELPTLGETTWVVRDHQTGRRLTQETGQSSLCLDEILAHQGLIAREMLVSHGNGEERKAAQKRRQVPQTKKHDAIAELTLRQQEAIVALLTCASVQEAADSVRIGRTTLYRWLKDETFHTAYQEARRQATAWVPDRLQGLVEKAVHTLEHILDDGEAPAPVRISAARTVLAFTSLGKKLHPNTHDNERDESRFTPTELSVQHITTREGFHDKDAKNLVERPTGDAATQ